MVCAFPSMNLPDRTRGGTTDVANNNLAQRAVTDWTTHGGTRSKMFALGGKRVGIVHAEHLSSSNVLTRWQIKPVVLLMRGSDCLLLPIVYHPARELPIAICTLCAPTSGFGCNPRNYWYTACEADRMSDI